MSSPPIVEHETTSRRSIASSSTLASTERQDHVLPDASEPSSARTSQVTPNASDQQQSRLNTRTNGSPTPKRGSIGRSGGFLLASTVKYGSLGKKPTKNHAASRRSVLQTYEPPRQATSRTVKDGSTRVLPGGHHGQQQTDGQAGQQQSPYIGHGAISNRPATGDAADDSTSVSDQATERPTETDDGAHVRHSVAIDPAQIVSMALNLSEGRRRHLTGNSVSSPGAHSNPKVASYSSTPSQLPYDYSTGGSLKKHLQDQRRISKHLTTKAEAKVDEQQQRRLSTTMAAADITSLAPYHLSLATISRAEKARNFFELATQYRRLLSNLPPVPHHIERASEEGVSSSSEQRASQSMGDPSLGRLYNPLQTIRNRRTRARSRRPLDPQTELWSDVVAVHDWVNFVENIVHDTSYHTATTTVLPRYPPKQHEYLHTTIVDGDKDQGIDSRKLTRPKLDWSVSPSELLADAYWLEQEGNRILVEDRHGLRLYPSTPAAEVPRFSVDGGHPGSRNVSSEVDKGLDSGMESEPVAQRGRNMQMDSANDSSGRLRHAWHKARRRSPSDSSEVSHSETDRTRRPAKRRPQQPPDLLSTGPLERYLNSMKEQQGSTSVAHSEGASVYDRHYNMNLATEELLSKRHKLKNDDLAEHVRPKADPTTPKDEKRTKRPPMPLPQQVQSTLGFWSPDSPVSRDGDAQSIDANKKHHDKELPINQRPPKNLFQFGRAHAKAANRGELGNSNADDSDKSSRRPSEEVKAIRPSGDIYHSPRRGQGLVLDTRVNDSVNSLVTSPSTYVNGKTRDPDSAVRRFFKGGMIGLRREGHRSRKPETDIPEKDPGMTDDTDTDFPHESDTEDTSGTGVGLSNETTGRIAQKSSARISTANASNENPHYHLDLPVFRPAGSTIASRPATPDQDPHGRHYARSPLRDASSSEVEVKMESSDAIGKVQTQSSSERPDHRQHHERKESSYVPRSRTQSQDASQRLHAVITDSGMDPKSRHSSTSPIRHPSLDTKNLSHHLTGRHWSITQAGARRTSKMLQPKALSRISHTDIARVRTLLICTGIKAAALTRRLEGSDRQHKAKSPRMQTFNMRALTDRAAMATAAEQSSSDIARESSALHDSATTFRNQTVLPLHRSLHELRIVVTESAEQTRTAGDEAVGFGALVTGQKTIEVRQAIDQMERFRRRRRRRVRWIRRVAFGLLEWGVLLIMWQVWFVVVIFKTFWSVIRGIVGVGRWALWL